jgi:hypothetical protein
VINPSALQRNKGRSVESELGFGVDMGKIQLLSSESKAKLLYVNGLSVCRSVDLSICRSVDPSIRR